MYLSSHQPGDFNHPNRVLGAHFSTKLDWVSSGTSIGSGWDALFGIFNISTIMNDLNGGSEFSKIKGEDVMFIGRNNHEGGIGRHDVDTWNDILKVISDFLNSGGE